MERRIKRSAHSELFGSRELTRNIRCAVIVAHPDDEVVGAGGLISRLKDVTVVHVMDSAPSNGFANESLYSDRPDDARARRQKCREALALANVSSEHIFDFGIKNHHTPATLADLARRVASFLQHVAPDVVLTHPYEGGHPDHDATAFATHAAVRLLRRKGFRPPVVFEIALRPSRDGKRRVLDFLKSDAAEITTLLLDKKTREIKRNMFACLPALAQINRDTAFARERFRRPPRYNFASAKGDMVLSGEAVGSSAFKWQSLVKEAWSCLFPPDQADH